MVKLKMPVKCAPYAHQKKAFKFAMEKFENSRGVAILAEMGCGKGLISIAVAGALFQAQKIRKLLIVCPLSICGVWQDEFLKFADFDYDLKILKGNSDKKAEILELMNGNPLQVAVLNYGSTWRIEKEIKTWNPDFIICDESHKLKSHKTIASKCLHRLGEIARYKMILTGTVITNKAIDAFSQYKFLDPSIYGKSFYAFRNHYFDMCGYGGYTPVLKKSMKPEFKQKLHSIAFRTTKAECLDLPETMDIVQFVELEPKAKFAYKSLEKESYAELSKGQITATNILTKLLRLSQLTGGFLCNDDSQKIMQVSSAKFQALDDIIENAVQSEKKIVVIARFIPEIKAIQKMVEKKHIKYSIVSGEIKNREKQIKNFQDDPNVLVFIGQIATAGLGITLTASSTMVFYSLDYSMSNFEQTKARIHRAGQRKNCTYIYLIAKNTVDEKVLASLRQKSNLATSLVDDYRRGHNPFKI